MRTEDARRIFGPCCQIDESARPDCARELRQRAKSFWSRSCWIRFTDCRTQCLLPGRSDARRDRSCVCPVPSAAGASRPPRAPAAHPHNDTVQIPPTLKGRRDTCTSPMNSMLPENQQHLMITVAPYGPQWMPSDYPEDIPVSWDAQVQKAVDCYNAGATVLHVHVRDPRDRPNLQKIQRIQLIHRPVA